MSSSKAHEASIPPRSPADSGFVRVWEGFFASVGALGFDGRLSERFEHGAIGLSERRQGDRTWIETRDVF